MDEQQHIGTRIRYWRKRRRGGMTQAVLAGLAGLSQSYISQIESGLASVERRSTLVAIARVLEVSVPDLLGQPGDPTDPLKDGAAAAVPAIRAALVEIKEGERREPTRGGEELAAAAERVDRLYITSDRGAMAPLLPSFLYDSAAYGGVTLVRAVSRASGCLRDLGYRDLALFAAEVAVRAAQETEDPAWLGAARFMHTVTMPVETAGTTSRVAERSIGELQRGAANVEVRQVLGLVHLSAGLACAVDGRPDDAAAHLAAAQSEADSLGDPADGLGFHMQYFGPTNVGLWRMNIALESGEPGRVLELAGKVEPRRLRGAGRHQAYWLDRGRALAHSGKVDGAALADLMRAERAAPLAFSLNPLARDAISAMVLRAQRRAVSEDLRILARRVGVPA